MLPTMLDLIPVLGRSSAANLSGPSALVWASSEAFVNATMQNFNPFRSDPPPDHDIIGGLAIGAIIRLISKDAKGNDHDHHHHHL